MSLFLLTFFGIYGGAHLYVFLKARAAFQFGPKVAAPLSVFMLLMVLAPVIVRLAERQGLETFARALSHVGYIWLGLLFFFFTASLALDLYRLFGRGTALALRADLRGLMPSDRTFFFIALSYALIASIYGAFEATDIRIERVAIKTPKLPPDAGVIKIAQISDVHLGLIVRKARLGAILDRVRAESPDILVSTGDLVDGQINGLPGLAELLQQIDPPLGKYAITGNHEFYAGLSQALDFTRKAGFTLLRGKAVDVGGLINLVGIDDHADGLNMDAKKVTEQALLSSAANGRFTLFLKHRPVVDKASEGLFDLQLSGHTHRGQLFPFRLLTKIFYPHVAGLYGFTKGSLLYVSRGSGTWGPPMRLLAPPEVTIIELHPEVAP